ncbi:hypothetical protein BM590_A0890 [Brucella melitensis M5-90]|nr:hypothetical protein BM590_A0890 [Brucella melitensis M5-90]
MEKLPILFLSVPPKARHMPAISDTI